MDLFYLKAATFVQTELPSNEYLHAVSVAHYVQQRMTADGANDQAVSFVSGLALLHDYLENRGVSLVDQDQKLKEFLISQSWVLEASGFPLIDTEEILERLTRRKGEDYGDYIKRCIKGCSFSNTARYAYIIKQADMKDHFSREKTLTDKLRQKYEPYLKYFLE